MPRRKWRRADLRDAAALKRIARSFKPQIVLHAAANPNIDYCEQHPEEAFAVNAQGTLNLIRSLPRRDIPFVYLSTDNVFDGRKASGYREGDLPNPPNCYGLSKLWGEHYVRGLCPKHYIVRTCWLFGDGPNFVTKLLAGERLKAADDWRANPTYTADLAAAIKTLVARPAPRGVYHLVNSRPVTRWDAFLALKKAAPRTAGVSAQRVKFAQLPFAARRPLHSVLVSSRFPPLRPWTSALADFLERRESSAAAFL